MQTKKSGSWCAMENQCSIKTWNIIAWRHGVRLSKISYSSAANLRFTFAYGNSIHDRIYRCDSYNKGSTHIIKGQFVKLNSLVIRIQS